MPASTSSKISVGTAPTSPGTTWIASAIRDSSPPDATLRQRPERLLRMGRDAELDLLDAEARRLGERLQRDFEAAAGHRQLLHHRGDPLPELVRRQLALGRQLARQAHRYDCLGFRGALRERAGVAIRASSASRASVSSASAGSASGRTRCLRARSWNAASRSSTRASSAGSRSSARDSARRLAPPRRCDARGLEQGRCRQAPDRAARPAAAGDEGGEPRAERGVAFGRAPSPPSPPPRAGPPHARAATAPASAPAIRRPLDAERGELALARGERVALGRRAPRLLRRRVAPLDRFAPRAPRGGDFARRAPRSRRTHRAARAAPRPAQRLCACWPCRSTSRSPISVS